MIDEQRLLNMPRRQLQDLAKTNRIRANLKSSEIVKLLLLMEGPIQGLPDDNSQSDPEQEDARSDEEANNGIQNEIQDDRRHDEVSSKGTQPVVHPESAAEEHQTDGDRSPRPDRQHASDDVENASDGPDHAADESAEVEAEGVSDIPEAAAPEATNEEAPVDDDECESNTAIAAEDAACVAVAAVSDSEHLPTSPNRSAVVQSSSECIADDKVDLQISAPLSTVGGADWGEIIKIKSDSDVIEPSSESHTLNADNVQDALDTYRKIAMQSNAELDAHGCVDIPEPSPSGKFASADGAVKKQLLPVGATPKKAAGKGDSGAVKNTKAKFDLQESLSRPINWEMKKGPLPPVSVQVLEDPNRLCLWSPSRMAERKKEFKNNDFGGTKRRLDGYMADGRSKLSETVRDLRKAADSAPLDDK